MVPLISSRCTGPLGVCQLPRTWWKMLTRSLGTLDSAYPDLGPALDQWVFDVLEVDAKAARDHIAKEKPYYLAFEAWIVEQRGSPPDPKRVARWNDAIEKRVHLDPRKIDETYPDIGFDRDKVTITSAVLLNCLQDWGLFHRNDLAGDSSDLAKPVIPLISSIDAGPLGVMQLPRTWLKILLAERKLLHPDYPPCTDGLDRRVFEALDLDREETVDYLQSSLPTYIEFEAWIREKKGGAIDRRSIDAFHGFMLNREHKDPKRSGILQRVGRPDDDSLIRGVDLNHLEDWHYAWEHVTGKT